jgi:hypothetical protein
MQSTEQPADSQRDDGSTIVIHGYSRAVVKLRLSDHSATQDQRHSMMKQKEQQNDNWDWHAK